MPSPASSRQSPCIAGTFQNQTRQVSCIEADPGNYVPQDASSSQTACSPGQYQPSPGQSICFSADPGYFTAEESSPSQEACQPGTYQPSSGQVLCLDTVPGTSLPIQDNQIKLQPLWTNTLQIQEALPPSHVQRGL